MTHITIPSIFAVLTILGTSAVAALHPLNNWLQWLPYPAGIIVFALAFWAINRTEKIS